MIGKHVTRAVLLAAMVLGLALAPASAQPAPPGDGPVVVELFTSQGCSSCPPADAFLAELADRPDVVALSLHVDYWNYMGWNDPFSLAAASDRQARYRGTMGLKYVYTPQMVVDGRYEGIGSKRATIEALIAKAKASARATVRAEMVADALEVTVGAMDIDVPATVWLVRFDDRHATKVKRGENAGRTIANRHVVRAIEPIGTWTGEAFRVVIPKDRLGDEDGCAVIVQRGSGPILGAAKFVMAAAN